MGWVISREQQSRARVFIPLEEQVAADVETVEELAQMVLLDPDQSVLWLDPPQPKTYVGRPGDEFTIPNTFYFSLGDVRDLSRIGLFFQRLGFFLGARRAGLKFVFNGAASKRDVLAQFADKDTYGFAWCSHGEDGSIISSGFPGEKKLDFENALDEAEREIEEHYIDPADVQEHHKLAFIWLFSCNSARREWRAKVAPRGEFRGYRGFYRQLIPQQNEVREPGLAPGQ
jgi:hypothetical protein